jgi:hypothetical protein
MGTFSPGLRRRVPALLAVPVALAVGGCDMSLGPLSGRATDEWTHTYPLAPGGVIRISNTNGKVDIEGVDGTTVEVRAEKVARAATDEGARELLPRITIREDAGPDRISIETERMGGLMIGANFEVRYHVRAPKHATLDLTNTNGVIALTDMTGTVVAHTTNGAVTGKNLSGAVDAHTTNGGVNVDMASVGPDKIVLGTTNGGVTLSVPENAKADVSASWTNGGINVSSVKMDIVDRSRRSLEGRLNGGGTSIELHTTNGGIRIRNRSTPEAGT